MNFKNQIPEAVRRIAEHIDVRVAGGAVRDLLLGVSPKDWDLATTCQPGEVLDKARVAGFQTIPTGLKHGTVTVVVDGEPLEITTLRIDSNHTGRHADVEYTTSWRTDSARRDFTVNSMFLDMEGNVHDYFGGQEDLKARNVRFVGDADSRMQEDFLRIMRLYRFCGKLGNDSCADTHTQAVRRNAHGLKQISGERIWSELEKILRFDMPGFLLRDMQHADVLVNIGMPPYMDASNLNGVSRLTENPVTRLIASVPFWDERCERTMMHTLEKRWKVSSKEFRLAKFLITCRPNLNALYLKNFESLVVLDNHPLDHVRELAALVGRKDEMHALENWNVPVFPVNGDDLKKVGVKPGKKMGLILSDLKRMWFENRYMPPKEELLVWVEKEYV